MLDLPLKIPKYFGSDSLYGEYNVYNNAVQNARYQPVKGGSRRSDAKQVLQLSSTELFSNRRYQLECKPKALGVENFPRRKVDFAKAIPTSLTRRCKSRPTSEMSNATLSKHSDDKNDDFPLFDEIIFSSHVDSDDSRRFSRQLRTYLLLRLCRYDVYNSRYRRSKFPYF